MHSGDPDKSDRYGNTGLHLAAAKGHIHCVDFLVKFGCNPFALDIDRHTAKDLAAINNRDDILRYLDAACAHLEQSDKKRCKQFREQAEKQCEKRIKEYAKQQQKIEEALEQEQWQPPPGAQQQQATLSRNGGGGGRLGEWKQRLWSVSQGNLKLAAGGSLSGATPPPPSQQYSTGAKFSALVGGGTLSGPRGLNGTVQRRAQAASNKHQQQQREFRIGGVDPGHMGGTIRSRNADVLYVNTFSNQAQANGDATQLRRGKISDVFGALDGGVAAGSAHNSDREQSVSRRGSSVSSSSASATGAGSRFGGTLSRAYSQPDFMAERMRERAEEEEDEEAGDEVSEEVLMQRPAGLFDRPMLGTLAFR